MQSTAESTANVIWIILLYTPTFSPVGKETRARVTKATLPDAVTWAIE